MSTKKNTILYIDDEPLNLLVFEEFFGSDYNIITLPSTKKAEEILKNNTVKVIVSDQNMPGETGIEFIQRINAAYPDILKMLFTAYSSQEIAIKAINIAGIYKYLTKPWEEKEVRSFIDIAIKEYDFQYEKKELLVELKQKNEALIEAYNRLEANEKKFHSIFDNSIDSIFILNHKNEIIEANQAFVNLIGYSKANHNLKDLNAFVTTKFPTLLANHTSPIKNFNNQLPDFSIVLDNDDQRIIELRSNEISYNNNNYILSIIHDISERRLLEKKIIEAIIHTQEEDQGRYARELHDGLGPLLSTLKMHIEWIANPDNSVNKDKIIEHSIHTIDSAIRSVKEIANNLSPHILQRFGLVNAVKEHIEQIKSASKIEFIFSSNLNERIKSNIEFILYRAILECLNNSVKYSQAKKIILKFNKQNNYLNISFSDNGKGFDVNKELAEGKGMGLFNIQNRIKHIGGEFKIISNRDIGTDITIRLVIN